MSNSVEILLSGYCRPGATNNSVFACGTSTLVRSSDQNILVDTLGPWQSKKLVELLAQHKIHPDDLSVVIGTHLHTDHIGNLNLFPKAVQYVGDQLCRAVDAFELEIFAQCSSIELGRGLELHSTPGHTMNDVSLIVRNAANNLGTVAIVGDLYESENDRDDEKVWLDAGSQSPDLQRTNRSRIVHELQTNWIVPGHGNIFHV